MAIRKETPEEKVQREKAQALLENIWTDNVSELQALMKEMMRKAVEGSLESEREEELGCTRYD